MSERCQSADSVYPGEANEPRRLRILWINCRLLHPVNGGDRLRTYHMLKQLKRRHHITYLSPRTAEDEPQVLEAAQEYCHEVIAVPHRFTKRGTTRFAWEVFSNTMWGSRPLIARKYRSAETARLIRDLLSLQRFDLIICDYLAPVINLLELPIGLPAPLVIFQHNVESLIWRRHYECARNPLKRLVFLREWRLTERLEADAAALADGQIAVSQEEFRYFKDQRGMNNTLGAVPTGVDCSYHQPSLSPVAGTIAFLGAMDWHANLDAVEFFVREVYPAIRRRVPEAKFLVIGRNPPPRIRALAAADPSIEVTGTVPDVRPYLQRASVMVLPLRVGGGTRIKVFEAMASGVPIVSTLVGAEGLPLVDGEEILLADEPADFAERTCRLLENKELHERIRQQARRLVLEKYSWETVAAAFEGLCLRAWANRKEKS
jgi:polysaccharide biosynthesis protein PslH